LRSGADYPGIVFATFALGVSRWLKRDALSRIKALTLVPVTHIVCHRIPAPA
jgi:hypothetical protein